MNGLALRTLQIYPGSRLGIEKEKHMPQNTVQAQPHEETLSVWSDGEERQAPNGRLAVLVDGLWAGYLYDGSRSIALFDVAHSDGKLAVVYRSDCRGKSKKALEKRIHCDHDIKFFDA